MWLSAYDVLMCAAKEGMNLALIYNTSSALVSGSASCPGGLACLLEQVGEAVVRAWHNTLQGEMGLFQEVATQHRYCHDASTHLLSPAPRSRWRSGTCCGQP